MEAKEYLPLVTLVKTSFGILSLVMHKCSVDYNKLVMLVHKKLFKGADMQRRQMKGSVLSKKKF